MISEIGCENMVYQGHEYVVEGITSFYRKLCNSEEVVTAEDNFYDKCPKLSDASKVMMDADRNCKILSDIFLFPANLFFQNLRQFVELFFHIQIEHLISRY